MTYEQDELWLNVLAGKAQANDLQTRQAASLRNYFAAEAQNTPQLDTAAQQRIMNMLEARGAFADKPVVAVPGKGLLTQFMAWLFPSGKIANPHFAAVLATMVLAVIVVPNLEQLTTADPGPHDSKGMTVNTIPSAIITSPSPDASAAQLMAVLARHGVPAQSRKEGDDRWVQARIPLERLAVVQADLIGMGLAASAQGDINVQYRPQR